MTTARLLLDIVGEADLRASLKTKDDEIVCHLDKLKQEPNFDAP